MTTAHTELTGPLLTAEERAMLAERLAPRTTEEPGGAIKLQGFGRAKPLNALTLAALPVGVTVWDTEIAYLNDAIKSAHTSPSVIERFKVKRDALVRARDWLQSKIDTAGSEGGDA